MFLTACVTYGNTSRDVSGRAGLPEDKLLGPLSVNLQHLEQLYKESGHTESAEGSREAERIGYKQMNNELSGEEGICALTVPLTPSLM